MRWLNPIAQGAEDRFLAERITIEEGSFAAVMRLQQRIKQNRTVGIRSIHRGGRLFELPFLGGRICIAPGAVELALATGAVLLPIFAVRNAAGHQEVHIEAPMEIDRSADRNEAIAKAMTDYVRRFEPYALKYPGQWGGWSAQVRPAREGEDEGVQQIRGDR